MAKTSNRDVVIEGLRERIRSGLLQPGHRLPSERALASEFGVSRASVQGAIDALSSLGLIECQINCRPTVKAVDFGTRIPDQNRNQIAVWIQPDLQDFGAANILQGIRNYLSSYGYSLLIGCPPSAETAEEQKAESAFLRSLTQNRSVAGAIVWECGATDFESVYASLVSADIPVVFIDREPPERVEADVVASNHLRAAKKAVQHLIALGHENIGMVVNEEPVSSVRDRVAGYRAALEESGIPFTASKVFRMEVHSPDKLVDRRQLFVDQFLQLEHPPTALFAVNDQIGMFLMEAFASRGISIPEDLSLVGFDWLLRWLPSGGELTTVGQPFDAIGRAAAERLIARIHEGGKHVACHYLLEAPLIIRSSTDVPRKGRTLRRDKQLSKAKL